MSAMPERVEQPTVDEIQAGTAYITADPVAHKVCNWMIAFGRRDAESRLLAAEARVREMEAERNANHADYLAKVRDNLALRAEVARLTDALGLCGVNAGSVNGVPKWWHVAADGSEPIHDTVEEAANAVWAVREAITAERDALVPLARDWLGNDGLTLLPHNITREQVQAARALLLRGDDSYGSRRHPDREPDQG